jgi:hypothetical protein
MSAILRAWGADFDPDQFLAESGLEPDNLYRKGEPVFPESQSDGRRHDQSGINLLASDADFCDFTGQIEEATGFLETHKSELARLRQQPGIEGMMLDFGIEWRDVIAQFDYLPPPLIRVAGELGLGIEISHYPVGDDADVTCGGSDDDFADARA